MRPPELEEGSQSTSTTAQSTVAPTKEKSTSGKKTDEGKGKKDKPLKEKKCKSEIALKVQQILKCVYSIQIKGQGNERNKRRATSATKDSSIFK